MKIVECVPNISEGRRPEIYNEVAEAAASVAGVELLDVDPGIETNRTVITFVGEPDAVIEGAFQLVVAARRLIDMRDHHGAHGRMGAVDVCPFVPVAGVTMDDCVELANRLGKRVGEELSLPVFLYEFAATRPERRSLADIRKGEYEALPTKLEDPDFAPDYGPADFVPEFGAMVIGARKFLVAYNVNLNVTDKRWANRVAFDVREKGRMVAGPDGKKVQQPGMLKAVRGMGWYIPEYGCAQVSMNLIDLDVTPVHTAFDACDESARRTGSAGHRIGARRPDSEGVDPRCRPPLSGAHEPVSGCAGERYRPRCGDSLGPQRGLRLRTQGEDHRGHPRAGAAAGVDDPAGVRRRDLARLGGAGWWFGGGSGGRAGRCAGGDGRQPAPSEICVRRCAGRARGGRDPGRRRSNRELLDAIDADTWSFQALMEANKVTGPEKENAVREATLGAARVPLEVAESCPEIVELCARPGAGDGGIGIGCRRRSRDGARSGSRRGDERPHQSPGDGGRS